LYGISATDLMAWNYLNASSVIYPGEKLLLQVTPPATATFTPLPPTETPLPTPTPSPTLNPTSTRQPTSTATSVNMESAESGKGNDAWIWLLAVGIAGVVSFFIVRSKKASQQ
ncbi:MAG: LysM domain-containing protein, partial [Anaerolineaceae bacterium]